MLPHLMVSYVTEKIDGKKNKTKKLPQFSTSPIFSPFAMYLCSASHQEEESIFLPVESGLVLRNAVCKRMGQNGDVLPALGRSPRGLAYLRSSLGVPSPARGTSFC